MYEEEHPGVYYNTAAVIDADGSYLGKYRKTHLPQVKGFWEKFYFRPGNLGYPVFDTAVGRIGVYICYDRHFPEGWRALGLAGARIVFNPSATSRGLSQYLWQLEQPASAVANEYFVGAINRVGVEELGDNDFYGQTYFVDPRGQLVGDAASDDKDEVLVRDLDMEQLAEVRNQWQFYRDRRPDTYEPLVSGEHDPHHRRQVVSATGTLDSDVLIAGEKIAACSGRDRSYVASRRRPAGTRRRAVDRVIDATGKYVMPGGVDVHTHMEMPFGGTYAADTFETGTLAAALGGTTSIMDFAVQAKGTSCSTLAAWHAKADGNCAIDYGFHKIIAGVNDTTLKEMDACIAAGVTSFKMFMAYPGVFYATDGEILLAMQQAADRRDDNDARGERHRHRRAGRPGARGGPDRSALPRPDEAGGAGRGGDLAAIMLAKVAKCPLYIVHVTSRTPSRRSRERGMGERLRRDLPAVLYLSLEDLSRPGFEGAAYVSSTPLRAVEGHQDSLWRALRTNDLRS